jgi:hypothetical protein
MTSFYINIHVTQCLVQQLQLLSFILLGLFLYMSNTFVSEDQRAWRRAFNDELRHRAKHSRRQHIAVYDAVCRYGWGERWYAPPLQHALEAPAKASLLNVDPRAQDIWLKALGRGVGVVRPNLLDPLKITALDRRWHLRVETALAIGSEGVQRHVDRIKREVRRRLRGNHYLGHIEISYHLRPGRDFLAFHFEGIVWGVSDLKCLRRCCNGGVNGAFPVVAKVAYDCAGAIRYATKFDDKGHRRRKEAYENSRSDTINLSARKLYRFVYACRSLDWPQMVLVGGEGIQIRDHALKRLGWKLRRVAS